MNPCDQLQRLFHEPRRLAIVSTLCSEPNGLLFAELKRRCDLTDGNLNRHLKALEKGGAVCIVKTRSGKRAVTSIQLSDAGRAEFMHYLSALEDVLKHAIEALAPEERAHLSGSSPLPTSLSSPLPSATH